MTLFLTIHPEDPQIRLIAKSVRIIRNGGVLVYPTDCTYALGCHIGDKTSLERICRIRNLDAKHHFTIICQDLSQVGIYARFDTPVYRLLKASTPGAYTFILRATKEVPRRLMHPKRKTIGIRIPDTRIVRALLAELNEPMLTTTLIMPEDETPMIDPVEIKMRLDTQVDLIIDGGFCGTVPTTLVDLSGEKYQVLRIGKGDPDPFF